MKPDLHRSKDFLAGLLFLAIGAGAMVVAREYPFGTAAGYLFATTKVDYFTGRPHAHIEILAVTRDGEGHGVARVLLRGAEAWADTRGYDLVTLNVFSQNQAARAVYDRLGYQPELILYRKGLGTASADGPAAP